MPAKLDPISQLNYGWPKGENDWATGMDENLRRIGVLLQNGIKSHTTQVPASPAVGDLYIVPPSATGSWAGKDGQIATWEAATWFFVQPRAGLIMYNTTTKGILVYNGATWVSVVATDPTAATAGRLVTVSSTGEFKSKGFTVDANGFYKSASPIVRLYADHIELNDDAAHQDITFERVNVGHYLVKGSSGFATDGWWFNVPVDSNGNKIVASTHDTLADGTLEIKTFKRKFDIETASIVPDLDNPMDIPASSNGDLRWIDIRLVEIDMPVAEDYIPLDDVTDLPE